MISESHISEDELDEYVRHRLNEPETGRIEEHLLMCEPCCQRLEAARDFRLRVKETLAQPTQTAHVGVWGRLLRAPAFRMGVALAAVMLVFAIISKRPPAVVPSASLVLTAVRGEMPRTAPAREFDLTLRDAPADGGPFRVEVVSATGAAIWSSLVAGGPAGIQVKEPRQLGEGDYFVRLYAANGKLVREYGFSVSTR